MNPRPCPGAFHTPAATSFDSARASLEAEEEISLEAQRTFKCDEAGKSGKMLRVASPANSSLG